MKKLIFKKKFSGISFFISVLFISLGFFLNSCSKSTPSPTEPEEYEYYIDDSGLHILILSEDGYAVYGSKVQLQAVISSPLVNGRIATDKPVFKKYPSTRGVCILPGIQKNTSIDYIPKPGMTPKQSFTCSMSNAKLSYRVTPKPDFFGGNNMPCYECLAENLTRYEFYFAICNGRASFGGSLLDVSTINSLNQSLGSTNFTGSQVNELVKQLELTGSYKCTKR